MIERTSCRGVRCRGKTNSVALCSQTMNQRARHASVSFTSSDDRDTIVGITRVRDERSDGGLRDRKTEDRRKKEKSNWGGGRVKGRNAFPRPEIAVSILAFINTSVARVESISFERKHSNE